MELRKCQETVRYKVHARLGLGTFKSQGSFPVDSIKLQTSSVGSLRRTIEKAFLESFQEQFPSSNIHDLKIRTIIITFPELPYERP